MGGGRLGVSVIETERQQVYRGNPVQPLIVGRRESGPATVLVVGMPKGGTTATAAMLHGTGAVRMGRQSHLTRTGRFEHPDFQSRENTWPAVARRWDNRHEIWGFKRPVAKWTPELVGCFRRPHLLIVTRDVFRVASRYWADGKLIDLEDAESFEQCLEAAERWWSLVREVIGYEFPKMVFSYEQLIRDPLSIVCHLDDWLGLGLDSRAIFRAVGRVSRSGGYVVPDV